MPNLKEKIHVQIIPKSTPIEAVFLSVIYQSIVPFEERHAQNQTTQVLLSVFFIIRRQ